MLVKVNSVKDIGFILLKKPTTSGGYNYRNTVNTMKPNIKIHLDNLVT